MSIDLFKKLVSSITFLSCIYFRFSISGFLYFIHSVQKIHVLNL